VSLRIVLVDDTPDLRLLLRVVIDSQTGLRVVGEAADGASGVALIRQERPDLVLLDLAMPTMDGLEAVPLIREVSPQTRIVVLSGCEHASMAESALAAGADAYLQKGATPDEIVTLLMETASSGSSAPQAHPPVAFRALEPAQTDLDLLQDAMATAAHELRSPATILVGLALTLSRRRGALEEATVLKLLDAIVRQARVLDRVTGDLLTASQSNRANVSVDLEAMSLRPALEGAALTLGEETEVRVECPDELWVQADRIRVDQMLGNLLSNAVKYAMPPLTITAQRAGDHVNIGVTDCGPGVPEDFKPRLFEQYSRARGLRASGTGLGLFVVRSLAEAQGGKAWYTPTAGGGSSFSFSLPRANALAAGA
jgi:signal transduction histidine kinase